MKKKRHHIWKNIMIMAVVFLVASGSSIILQKTGVHEHITAIFIFAVFLTSILTDGYIYGIVSALVGTLAVNYAYTYPFYALDFRFQSNMISAVVMMAIAVLTGMLTTQVKTHEAIKAESEKERMRANLLRAVSHDIRTPLTTIYGASTTLLESGENYTKEQRIKILKGIQEDSDWLMRMVENLLSITRIDEGKIKIIKTPTVLDELIDSVMVKFHKRYPQQEVYLDLPEDIIIIPMDAILIEQVIFNLLENAVLHADGMTELVLKVFVLGQQVVFEVSDDGCGIEKERLSGIFNGSYHLFEDKASSADSQKHNSGIGLSVCQTIIKAHDGVIAAENNAKGGAVFRFSLNREETSESE